MRTPRLWPGRMLYALMERVPPPHPVELRIVKRIRPGAVSGRCLYQNRPRRFVIYIESGREWTGTKDTLIHEYAHVLSWRNADHGPAWALAYGKCYRASLEWWKVA